MSSRPVGNANAGAYDVSEEENLEPKSAYYNLFDRLGSISDGRTHDITISQSSRPNTLEMVARVQHRKMTMIAASTKKAILIPSS